LEVSGGFSYNRGSEFLRAAGVFAVRLGGKEIR
jgi:hypothetical protein